MRKHHRTYRLLAAPVLILLLANYQTSPLPARDGPTPLSFASPADGTETSVLEEAMPAYQNPQLPTEDRVEDLLSLMTLEEKVGQMNSGREEQYQEGGHQGQVHRFDTDRWRRVSQVRHPSNPQYRSVWNSYDFHMTFI